MRNILPLIIESLKNGSDFVYCFKFSKNNLNIYLTSGSNKVILGENIYFPYSGLSFAEGIFNDSAQNCIKITGIYEDKGISNNDLIGASAEIIIFLYQEELSYSLLTYYCSKIISKDLEFTLYLEPLANKLHQTLLDCFSLTCRAKLGDDRCKVDTNLYPKDVNCDKSFRTCCIKFNNAVNFRGEPFIPSIL